MEDILRSIHSAIELLKSDQKAKIEDLRIEITGNKLSVIGWSQYKILGNLNKRIAFIELNEIKDQFHKMTEVSIELKDFIQNKEIEYNLYFDDYGKASFVICTEKNGVIQWFISR